MVAMKELKKWLNEKNVLIEWETQVRNTSYLDRQEVSDEILNYSIHWATTKEGSAFWQTLSHEWRDEHYPALPQI